MEIAVLFLGLARDLTGVEQVSLTLSNTSSVQALREVISVRFPRIKSALPTIRFAVNQVFVTDVHMLQENDEVAVIPPVSGG